MTNPVAQALAAGSDVALREALSQSRVAIIMTARDGQNVPAIMTDGEEVRSLVVFSGQETFELWQRPEVVDMVPGSELGNLAVAQRVDRVLFDPAGPTPMGFAPGALQAIIDGISTNDLGEEVLLGEQAFREGPATEQTLGLRKLVASWLREPAEAYVLERVIQGHGVTTLAVSAPEAKIQDLVLSLSGAPGIGTVDVVVLDAPTRDLIREQIPQARVNPGAAGGPAAEDPE